MPVIPRGAEETQGESLSLHTHTRIPPFPPRCLRPESAESTAAATPFPGRVAEASHAHVSLSVTRMPSLTQRQSQRRGQSSSGSREMPGVRVLLEKFPFAATATGAASGPRAESPHKTTGPEPACNIVASSVARVTFPAVIRSSPRARRQVTGQKGAKSLGQDSV